MSDKKSSEVASHCIWAKVGAEVPWQEWWKELTKEFSWPDDLVIERWTTQDLNWSRVLDSLNTFTLFRQHKALIISDADKVLKTAPDLDRLLQRFKKGPHKVVFQSEQTRPTKIDLPHWQSQVVVEETDNRAGFRWIDGIHAENLPSAIAALDAAIDADQHPFALLQLLTRDYRIGRLIHYAHQSRLKEQEITSSLKVPGFVAQKWIRRQTLSRSLWAQIFDRLLAADLELKSGVDGIWALRKLTFDLVQMRSSLQLKKTKKQPSRHEPLLWPAAPSFA